MVEVLLGNCRSVRLSAVMVYLLLPFLPWGILKPSLFPLPPLIPVWACSETSESRTEWRWHSPGVEHLTAESRTETVKVLIKRMANISIVLLMCALSKLILTTAFWSGRDCCCSVAQLCPTRCDPMDCSTPGFPVLHHLPELLKLMPIESLMPSNHFIFCCPLLLLPLIFPSIKVFSNKSVLHIRWPKYWSFSFSISPSNEYSGLISFRMDWLDLLAVQGTLKSLLKHHSSKAWILWRSAFFIVQL